MHILFRILNSMGPFFFHQAFIPLNVKFIRVHQLLLCFYDVYSMYCDVTSKILCLWIFSKV